MGWQEHQDALIAALKTNDHKIFDVAWNKIASLRDPHISKMLPFIFKKACESGVQDHMLDHFLKRTQKQRANANLNLQTEFINPGLVVAYQNQKTKVIEHLRQLGNEKTNNTILERLTVDKARVDGASRLVVTAPVSPMATAVHTPMPTQETPTPSTTPRASK